MSKAFTWRRLADRVELTVAVVFVVAPAVFVFLWMLSLGLKNDLENAAYPPVFIPSKITLDNFTATIQRGTFLRYSSYVWPNCLFSVGSS